MNGRYSLDKANAKLMGVCAGLANATGIDPMLVRILAVLSIFLLGPIAILFYLLVGWVAPANG